MPAERTKKKEEFHPCFCGEVLNTNLSGKDKFGSLIKFLPQICAHRKNTRQKEVVGRRLHSMNSFYRKESLFLNVYINSAV